MIIVLTWNLVCLFQFKCISAFLNKEREEKKTIHFLSIMLLLSVAFYSFASMQFTLFPFKQFIYMFLSSFFIFALRTAKIRSLYERRNKKICFAHTRPILLAFDSRYFYNFITFVSSVELNRKTMFISLMRLYIFIDAHAQCSRIYT